MRLLLLFSWGVYPIGVTGTSATVGVQLGYAIADILAKPIYGLDIFGIAVAKSAKIDRLLHPIQETDI